MTKSTLAAALAALSLLPATPAFPQAAASFPSKSITIIVPASPGGAIDLVARLTGDKMSKDWGKPVVIDNKAGATGTIGTQAVATAPPDGHMLALVASSHAINPVMFKKLPYDTVKSFEPVILTHVVPLVLVVNPKLPVNNVKELIAYGKANPTKLTCGSVGPASTTHFACELLNLMGGISTIHIPYKGSAPVIQDMLGGQISLAFINIAGVKPQIDAKQLRPLGVTTLKRSGALPDVPTMSEVLPGFEVNSWYGMMAPAGTPKEIVHLLQRETAKALKLPDVADRLRQFGLDPVGSTPEEHAAQLRSDLERWAKVAKVAKVKID